MSSKRNTRDRWAGSPRTRVDPRMPRSAAQARATRSTSLAATIVRSPELEKRWGRLLMYSSMPASSQYWRPVKVAVLVLVADNAHVELEGAEDVLEVLLGRVRHDLVDVLAAGQLDAALDDGLGRRVLLGTVQRGVHLQAADQVVALALRIGEHHDVPGVQQIERRERDPHPRSRVYRASACSAAESVPVQPPIGQERTVTGSEGVPTPAPMSPALRRWRRPAR